MAGQAEERSFDLKVQLGRPGILNEEGACVGSGGFLWYFYMHCVDVNAPGWRLRESWGSAFKKGSPCASGSQLLGLGTSYPRKGLLLAAGFRLWCLQGVSSMWGVFGALL